jgi:hypothetical protein
VSSDNGASIFNSSGESRAFPQPLAFAQERPSLFEHRQLRDGFLLPRLGRATRPLEPFLDGREIGERELELNDLSIARSNSMTSRSRAGSTDPRFRASPALHRLLRVGGVVLALSASACRV